MQADWDAEMEDEDYEDSEAFDGPDAYLEGDEDDEEDLEEELEQLTADQSGTSMREILASMVELQQLQESNAEPSGQQSGGQGRGFRVGGLSLHELSRLLGAARRPDDDEVEDEEDDEFDDWGRPRIRASRRWFDEVKEPQKAGVDLLMSGEFGRVGHKMRSRRDNKNIAKFLNNRGNRPRAAAFNKEDITGNLIPNSNGTAVAAYHGANVYCGQYSTDSSFYYTCAQDFRLHVYDTAAEPIRHKPDTVQARRAAGNYDSSFDPSLDTTMKVIKTIQGNPGRWTITDSHLSPDNERMIYSSITSTVYMASTRDASPTQIPIRFSDIHSRATRGIWGLEGGSDSFGLWSCKFSADGNEVIAGGSGKIFVYDLLADKRTVKIAAHNDDVNSCCWADTASGNVLISASDDTFLKVWDRRSLGASQKPSGVLVGHTEGITNVSAKGDGRYIISNGKDQALRLWDLRKMHSSYEFEKIADDYYGLHDFDYRNGYYPKPRHVAHPKDCSVMTYRGHAVLRTLIRCHFSPSETTGSQYIYSGSADGKIHIWSLDGQVVQVLDRSKTLPIRFDPSGPELEDTRGVRSNVLVRDVSWHSQEPVILSAGWESGRRSGSIIARHEWKGLSKMSGGLKDWVEKSKQEGTERAERAQRRSELRGQPSQFRVPGAFESDED